MNLHCDHRAAPRGRKAKVVCGTFASFLIMMQVFILFSLAQSLEVGESANDDDDYTTLDFRSAHQRPQPASLNSNTASKWRQDNDNKNNYNHNYINEPQKVIRAQRSLAALNEDEQSAGSTVRQIKTTKGDSATSAQCGDQYDYRSPGQALDDNVGNRPSSLVLPNSKPESMGKTNPLIESKALHSSRRRSYLFGSKEEEAQNWEDDDRDDSGDDEEDGAEERTTKSSLAPTELPKRPAINGRHRQHSKVLFALETADGGAHHLKAHRGDWCESDCNRRMANGAGQGRNLQPICASDGRLYKSMCELRRHSCRNNLYLFRRPKVYCPSLIGGNNNQDASQGEEVRIVELKSRCNIGEFERMKLLLLREFNGNIESMFRYFDSNNDNYIEAHELWPRRATESNKLLYAQVWDEHSSKCKSPATSNYRLIEDNSKCWFFLDFTFEPQFANNPCSLSHLMLFDLKHPSSRFDFGSFERAFLSLRVRHNNETAATKKESGADKEALKKVTPIDISLGDSRTLNCLGDLLAQNDNIELENDIQDESLNGSKCYWSRYNFNLGAIQDPHISIDQVFKKSANKSGQRNLQDLVFKLKDAQLYLSGQFKCSCHLNKVSRDFEHFYNVRVLAKPRVHVRPHSQWSLPKSRVSFECQYDYIDTSQTGSKSQANGTTNHDDIKEDKSGSTFASKIAPSYALQEAQQTTEFGQFGLRVKWLKDNQELLAPSAFAAADTKAINRDNGLAESDEEAQMNKNGTMALEDEESFNLAPTALNFNDHNDHHHHNLSSGVLSQSSPRASISLASSRLTMERLLSNDTGSYVCRVEAAGARETDNLSGLETDPRLMPLYGQDEGSLVVQEQLRVALDASGEELGGNAAKESGAYLWMFHDNGISIYRLQNDDGQEMELVREINGHSLVNGEVDGNWNQLTLCGGLNPEQVVICEWSDNALYINVEQRYDGDGAGGDDGVKKEGRKYVYVGQPNLNRIIVMDGLKFEIVAIINTEPQPRKLHSYKPNKVHLSKWVRRRLSPAASLRWMSAIGSHAHPLKSTPNSKLYSTKPTRGQTKRAEGVTKRARERRSDSGAAKAAAAAAAATTTTNQTPSDLTQHDIWLLCYGQPLIVDPSGEEYLGPPADSGGSYLPQLGAGISSGAPNSSINGNNTKRSLIASSSQIQPFTPRLSPFGGKQPFAWSVWPNKESKLRNRKSVHIIQSTFFPRSRLSESDGSRHGHNGAEGEQNGQNGPTSRRLRNETVVGEFKRSTVITTHHVFAGVSKLRASKRYFARAQSFDLVQDLIVPPKPYSLAENEHHKIHYAYVTHYDEQRLFRVSMDEYRYDKEIDIQNCDPINLMTTAQGLLVIQCRAPIAHNLIGQLVLDQLTSSRIEFNANIRAQESYLSPDNRYLVSVFTNQSTAIFEQSSSINSNDQHQSRKRSPINEHGKKGQSVIYVQLVTISGLRLQYEIKTSLEISQCSFVWKDGYYVAIFVSTNRKDLQSEILSLRLADSRLELMARVPGLVSTARHKDQLVVSPELRLAALSTNQGTYVVDMEDNRVSQSLRHHQSPPTLLWV